MRITLLTYGSRGDVEPFIALAAGLNRAGHSIRLAAPQVFEHLISTHDIEFFKLPGDPDALVRELVDKAGKNYLRMIRQMSKFVLPLAVDVLEQAREACEDTDLIIHSFLLTNTGYEIARDKEIADISAQFFPVFSTTAEFPGIVFPDLPLGDAYRRLTHALITQTFWQGSRILYRWVRRNNPQLTPLSGWPFSGKGQRQTPILYAFSPTVIPQPEDWGEPAYVTGYWFMDSPDWQPPSRLISFLDSGPKPVAITFGSTATRNVGRLAETIVEALALSDQRGVIVGARELSSRLPENVIRIDFAPYQWLFPRTTAVVHHGGAGTTGAGLAAGVPNIVTPFTSDQPFWASRVYALGAGPKPIPAKRLSSQALAGAINTAVNDHGIQKRAREIGERISAEDGVATAVDIIHRIMNSRQ